MAVSGARDQGHLMTRSWTLWNRPTSQICAIQILQLENTDHLHYRLHHYRMYKNSLECSNNRGLSRKRAYAAARLNVSRANTMVAYVRKSLRRRLERNSSDVSLSGYSAPWIRFSFSSDSTRIRSLSIALPSSLRNQATRLTTFVNFSVSEAPQSINGPIT
jgi:hypothetical protein